MQLLNIRQDLNINVEILNPEGSQTIVMVHGMFGNLSQFYLTIGPFLARDFKVIMFDLKSHGRSDRATIGYSLESHAYDLNDLLDSLDIKQVNLLGFSYGALISLKYAMLFQSRVNSLIAIEVPDKPRYPFKQRGAYTFDDFWEFVVYLNDNIRENFFRSHRQVQKTFKVYEYIYNETTFSVDTSVEAEFSEEDYSRVLCPVLLSYGDKSPCIGEYYRIKDWIPNVDSVIGQGDHGFFMDDAENFSQLVSNFLTNVLTSSSTASEQMVG